MKIGFEAKRVFHNKTGLGNYSRDLIRILSTYYPDNTYFLYNPKPSYKNLFSSLSEKVVEKLPSTAFYKKFYNIWRQKTIVCDIVKDKIELFHGLSGEIPFGIKNKKIKTVVTIHDLIFFRFPNFYSFFDRHIHAFKFKHAAKKADIIIAISEQTKKDIVQFLHIEPSKIKVIYQGCHAAFKKQYSDNHKQIVREKYKLPTTYILNVGTIEERKNILSVVEAIKNTATNLVIVGGKTNYTKKVTDYITENNMAQRVHFLKGLSPEELAIVYQEAEIFVYPSLFEGFGIPIIEALYSRTPVITNINGCFSEAGGPSSVYVNPTNPKEIAFQINRLLNDLNFRNNIIEKGYAYAQRFNDDVIAKEIMETYDSLIAN
jgi:glycosyltransferase involved in cell wall biosynthesis